MALTRKQMRTFLNAVEAGASFDDAASQAEARLSAFYTRADTESTNYDARFAAEFASVQSARARMLTWRQAEEGKWPAIDKVGNVYVDEMKPQAQQLNVTGDVEVNHPDVAAAIARFTAQVVSLANGRGAAEPLALSAGESTRGPDVPVARVDSEAEPGGTAG